MYPPWSQRERRKSGPSEYKWLLPEGYPYAKLTALTLIVLRSLCFPSCPAERAVFSAGSYPLAGSADLGTARLTLINLEALWKRHLFILWCNRMYSIRNWLFVSSTVSSDTIFSPQVMTVYVTDCFVFVCRLIIRRRTPLMMLYLSALHCRVSTSLGGFTDCTICTPKPSVWPDLDY